VRNKSIARIQDERIQRNAARSRLFTNTFGAGLGNGIRGNKLDHGDDTAEEKLLKISTEQIGIRTTPSRGMVAGRPPIDPED